jgi:hypothetical protein
MRFVHETIDWKQAEYVLYGTASYFCDAQGKSKSKQAAQEVLTQATKDAARAEHTYAKLNSQHPTQPTFTVCRT